MCTILRGTLIMKAWTVNTVCVQCYSYSVSMKSEGVNGIQLTHVSVQRWVVAKIHKPSGFVKGEGFAAG
jgi:hypothetical protein